MHCLLRLLESLSLNLFKVSYLPLYVGFLPGECCIDVVVEELSGRDVMLRCLKKNLAHAKQQMVKFANRQWRELEFSVGDRVILKVMPYHQTSIASQTEHKLAAKFYGPFKVEHRVGHQHIGWSYPIWAGFIRFFMYQIGVWWGSIWWKLSSRKFGDSGESNLCGRVGASCASV